MHDAGRFPQYVCYSSFRDVDTVDNGTAGRLALALEGNGWKNVKVMEGGIMAWPYPREK